MGSKSYTKFLPYGSQWIEESDIQVVQKALRSGWLTQGPLVEKFEQAMAKYCGSNYAVAVSSGTSALHAAYAVAGIRAEDEVITPPLSFSATANAIVYCGGKPVFSDIDEDTLCIDPYEIEKKITKRTKAIAPVDFAGRPAEYDVILKIAKKHKLLVIEDAAHALGSVYKGSKIGSIADMTILSFHPVKTITTGEGGMILTNRRDFYERLKVFRHHGIVKKPEKGGWYYDIEQLGNNYRITDFQCALGLSQLRKLPGFAKRRREIVTAYNRAFEHLPFLILPRIEAHINPVFHLYVVQLRLDMLKTGRKTIFEDLHKQGIGVQVHYIPVHLLSFYQKQFGYKKGDFPVTERYYERTISLPLFPKMSLKDVERVIKVFMNTINMYAGR
ncbi:MAG: UDP-4-amino-4,6-dideoxy-N-acetyl-beta-L-altrosamine transaminase [Candidatus Wildermuthbacteria bacterium RIFCSPHIGHO2_02_FULL_45_25]|uniref:UDP-4-amino-4, 6-dideoxy-N-acetyl-beta-L-altrosamine transaminase n=1 Tax=Candidatus Wildermuthbacteria bacterium RIFCSPHIGHO2_02_FULL_45_25 TaxID=1802450 RepID=A0A1G2R3S1_9BACT|nr:MAG: UDP-4-amino-4,6-dideoxy-N-acetyl-beta-L-altrosamine transaminase [Candidatus Wildermuthbacteria bacterium RIFCSPHIGHO2_02_FULL_45_25]